MAANPIVACRSRTVVGDQYISLFTAVAPLLAHLLLLSSCATRVPSNVHPHDEGHYFEHIGIDMGQYRSVQDRDPDLQDEDLALAVSISGGGQRAANLGAGVLIGLEEIQIESSKGANLLSEIDYFSTVSGGGMVAGAYISSLFSHVADGTRSPASYSFNEAMKSHENASRFCKDTNVEDFYDDIRAEDPDQICDPCLRRHLERGYHKNMLGAIRQPAVIFTNLDRGDMLERTFSREVMGRNWTEHDLSLGDVFLPHDSRKVPILPYWVCNATVFENGAIFPFTPDVLERYGVRGYTHDMEKVQCPESDGQIEKEFFAAVPLSLGMTANGSFPSLITSRTLMASLDAETQKNHFIHLLDGGLSDNLGVFTALDLLQQDDRASRKAIVVVDAFPGEFPPIPGEREVRGSSPPIVNLPR
jgi:hypothetical protein